MAKTVFGSHDMTSHVWAQGRGGDVGKGRSSDERVFFERRVLFSYGRHFALGVVALDSNGGPVATFLNSSRYSPSTGKHQSHASSAARGAVYSVPNLTAICYTIQDLTNGDGRKPAPHEKAILARHIADHWAMDSRNAVALYALAGGTEKQANAIINKARKAADKKRADEAKADFARLIDKARNLAKMDSDAFRARHRDAVGTSEWDAPRRHDSLLADMRKAHKAASKAGLEKVKVKIWTHIKAMETLGKTAKTAALVAHKNRYAKGAIRTLRQYWANAIATEPKTLNSSQWGQVSEAASAVLPLTNGRDSLASLSGVLSALIADAREAKFAARETEQETARLERIESDRIAALEEEEQKAQWMAGNTAARWRGRTPTGGAYIRAVNVEIDGLGDMTGTLQTSQGADVPLAHALRAFRFIKLCHDKGQAWAANGRTVPVGHFRIDRIEANGDFVAGCHRIEWVEVERLALALGVAGWQADESAVVTTVHA